MAEPGRNLRFPARPRPAIVVSLWEKREPPDTQSCRDELVSLGYQPIEWSTYPADGFSPHAHIYPELVWLMEGSLTVVLPSEHRLIELFPGDRIEIPAGTAHGLVAGEDGAKYLIATR